MQDLDRLAQVRGVAAASMDKIAEQFKPGSKLTLLVRQPSNPDADFVLTNDELPKAMAALHRRHTEDGGYKAQKIDPVNGGER